MASRTRRLVCSEIGRLPVRTYETVLWDTPATRATSLLVYAAIANPFSHAIDTHRRYVSQTLAKPYSRVPQITRPPSRSSNRRLRRLRPRRIGGRSHELNGAGFNSSAVALICGY